MDQHRIPDLTRRASLYWSIIRPLAVTWTLLGGLASDGALKMSAFKLWGVIAERVQVDRAGSTVTVTACQVTGTAWVFGTHRVAAAFTELARAI